jgi:hypothetical protein
MIRAWPPSYTSLVHSILCRLWAHHHIPKVWRRRLLTPLPKIPGSTALSNLRPITLYDCLRKIWTTLITNQIQHAWEHYRILSDSQHGFRPGRSTTTAILHLINSIEAATLNPNPTNHLYITLWDISKAFDSVTKTHLQAAWHRLGVPPATAQWLTQLDIGGSVHVKSPHYQHNPTSAHFTTERGVGQGDVQSPIIWAGFFDILLRALELDPSSTVTGNTPTTDFTRLHDPAFADDLATIARKLADLQRKADIVSAFALIFDLTISPTKLQLFSFSGPSTSKHLTIHGPGWTPYALPFTTDTHFRYLGLHIDTSYNGKHQLDLSLTSIRQLCHIIKHRHASPTIKYTVARSVAMSKAMYTGQLSPLSLSQYHQLDQPFNDLLRHSTRNLPGFPTKLLYLPTTHGGLGFTRFSYSVQLQ